MFILPQICYVGDFVNSRLEVIFFPNLEVFYFLSVAVESPSP